MRDPMFRDAGEFKTCYKRKTSHEYNLWNSMRSRCYKNHIHKNYSGYVGCTVDQEWHGFQAFALWVTKQIGFDKGFQLDKDLLVKGNRIYAPDRCVLLPKELNCLILTNKHIRGELPIGVRKVKDRLKDTFTAHLNRAQKNIHLGTYSTPESAFAAYKIAKEEYIKEVAENYRSIIDQRAYEALIAYEVEITD